MTPRERYLETLLFGDPDHLPLMPGGPRESTLRAWREQGLDPDRPWYEQVLEAVGMDPKVQAGAPGLGSPVTFRMIPEFEEKVLEHKDGHYLVQDWMGAIVEISDTYDLTYLRHAKDFVTRKWHKFPVESPRDFDRMRERYDAATPERWSANEADVLTRAAAPNRDEVYTLCFNGPFWQLREWCGFEGLCVLFVDDPGFVREMVGFWTEFAAGILTRACKGAVLDHLFLCEDMAYKGHSMISPAMTAEFLGPAYERWLGIAREAGCRVFEVDSDGYVGELIPVWIELGINVCSPMEVAAGNDLVDFRRRFGERMAYVGGIDKREMAKGGEALRREIDRVVPPLLETGGFIPSCDHGVPPDISLENFIEHTRLLAQYGGWV